MRITQLTREEAIEFYVSRQYETMTDIERARFQMQQELACMPVEIFHKSLEIAVGHPVFIYEILTHRRELLCELGLPNDGEEE